MLDKVKDRVIYNKLVNHYITCPICKRVLTTADAPEIDYIKTKRGTEIFIHTDCVRKWGV